MYFKSRSQAGELLANQLEAYRYQDTAVLALSAGGVLVGEQIAKHLHCTLSLLVTQKISAMGDPSLVLGSIDSEGGFVYNDMIPSGEMEEYLSEMWMYLEEEKLRRLYDMTSILGHGGSFVDRETLVGKNIIIATDGVSTGLSFDAAIHYLKPIHIERTVAAIPVGPASVIERINMEVDEMHYLYIPDNFYRVKHYYDDNSPIDSELILSTINQTAGKWR